MLSWKVNPGEEKKKRGNRENTVNFDKFKKALFSTLTWNPVSPFLGWIVEMENWTVWEDLGIVYRMKKSWFVASLKLGWYNLCGFIGRVGSRYFESTTKSHFLLERHILGAISRFESCETAEDAPRPWRHHQAERSFRQKRRGEFFSSIVPIILPFWKTVIILVLTLSAFHDNSIENNFY